MAAARTDSAGRFALEGLPPGAVTLTVESAALDSLGVGVPAVRVEVAAGAAAHAALAVPSRATLLAIACPGMPLDADAGVLLGIVRDARALPPVPGAAVEVSWSVWTVNGGRLSETPVSATVASGAGGLYRACGVPAGAPVRVRASAGARASGDVTVAIAAHGIARRDLVIGAPGDGALRGTVASAEGSPLAGARIQLAGDGAAATSGEDGAFTLAGIPSGTRRVEVRRVGSAPRALDVDVRAGEPTRLAIALSPAPVRLDAVAVEGGAGPAADDAAGFDARRKRGVGRFVDRDRIATRGDVEAPELLRGVPGMDVRSTPRGATATWVRAMGGCTPRYYVDGSETDVRGLPRAGDIQGIEVYAPGEAPPRYGGARATCAVVLIWTRRPG